MNRRADDRPTLKRPSGLYRTRHPGAWQAQGWIAAEDLHGSTDPRSWRYNPERVIVLNAITDALERLDQLEQLASENGWETKRRNAINHTSAEIVFKNERHADEISFSLDRYGLLVKLPSGRREFTLTESSAVTLAQFIEDRIP